MNEATIITFANQKGGVGKTTLCTLFANYLVARGKRTIVIDCDGQQTIFEKRKADHKKYSDLKEPYKVQAFNIADPENVKNLMQNLRQLNGTVLIDAPGNLAQQGLIPLFVHSDYIVCPYQYETTSINSTVTFLGFILQLKKRVQSMATKIFFVPRYSLLSTDTIRDMALRGKRSFGLRLMRDGLSSALSPQKLSSVWKCSGTTPLAL